MRYSLPLLLFASTPALAQQLAVAPPPHVFNPHARGEQMIEAYMKDQVKRIADKCLTDLTTLEEWEKRRPELRKQFLEMMGLWPMPPRTELNPVVTGKVEADTFTIEKLHFQS